MKRGLWVVLGLILITAVAYISGPEVPDVMLNPDLPEVTQNLPALDAEIHAGERKVKGLKPDNEARIVWAGSSMTKTPYSFVYIHGFGASWAEGEPVHRNLAKRYGANLYLARLEDAGIDNPDAYENLTPQLFLDGAKRALAIGKAIGDTVVLIGTSAGGLLSVYLAATNPDLKGLLLYSPCMDIYGSALKVATGHWGQQAVNAVVGKRMINDYSPERQRYWMNSYSSKGLVTLQQTIEAIARPEIYARIKMPVFMGYYYKNEEEQDKTVSVEAMQEMFPLLGTPPALKVAKAFPESGHHVIASYLTSRDVAGVQKASQEFIENILKIAPVKQAP